MISKIQTMRKEAGFEVMDHIGVYQANNDKIAELMKSNADEIKGEVMADYIHLGEMKGFTKGVEHQRRNCYVRCREAVK